MSLISVCPEPYWRDYSLPASADCCGKDDVRLIGASGHAVELAKKP